MNFTRYNCAGVGYYLVKDIMSSATKKFKTESKFLETLNLPHVFGRIGFDDVSFKIDEVRSKRFSKTFVKISDFEATPDFQSAPKEMLNPLPAVLDQNEFCFFKDNAGTEYNVQMYGKRNKEEIYFHLKDVEKVLELNRLNDTITHKSSSFILNVDYIKCSDNPVGLRESANKGKAVILLSFPGLLKTMQNCKVGRGKEFVGYIESIVFATIAGDVEQKKEAVSMVMHNKMDVLKEIFGKHSGNIACIYIFETKFSEDSMKIYKYGFTNNLERRFKEHVRTFGEIDPWCFSMIQEDKLSEAEAELKACLSSFNKKSSLSGLESQSELLFLDDNSKKNVKSVMDCIFKKYSNQSALSLDSIKQIYESKISKMEHELEKKELMHSLDVERLEHSLELANLKLANEQALRASEKEMLKQTIACMELKLSIK